MRISIHLDVLAGSPGQVCIHDPNHSPWGASGPAALGFAQKAHPGVVFA